MSIVTYDSEALEQTQEGDCPGCVYEGTTCTLCEIFGEG